MEKTNFFYFRGAFMALDSYQDSRGTDNERFLSPFLWTQCS